MRRFLKAYHHMLNNSTKPHLYFSSTFSCPSCVDLLFFNSSSATMKQQQGKFCLIAAYDHGEQDLEMILEDHEATSSSSFDGSDLSSSSSLSLSSSSSDSLDDDASSQSNEALFDLSNLMSNLPIKRGLSKFYQGKSQSFTSLASVTSLEDLAKKVNDGGYSKRLKACKSYGGGLNLNCSKQRSLHINTPKSTISKKSSSNSSSTCFKGKIKNGSSYMMCNRSTINVGKPPLSPVQI